MVKLTVSKNDVAEIISLWWADYAAHPEKFKEGPDCDGRSSADCFFDYAAQAGIKED